MCEELPRVRAPALVVHREHDRAIRLSAAREVAALLPRADLVTLPGDAHLPWHGDGDAGLRVVAPFLGIQAPHGPAGDAGPGVPGELSAREREVLGLIARGLSDAQIAERLVLSPHTVHRHVANILAKLRLPTAPRPLRPPPAPACCDRIATVARSGHPKMACPPDAGSAGAVLDLTCPSPAPSGGARQAARKEQTASTRGRGDHMSATLAIRHHVSDYAAWQKAYDEAEPLRAQHGCTAQRVMRLPDDGNELFVTHDFPTAEQAGDFAHDPVLREAMGRAGVEGAPRIEIFTDV